MTSAIKLLKGLKFWHFVGCFTVLAVTLSMALCTVFCYLLEDAIPTSHLLVNVTGPVVYGFVIACISAAVVKSLRINEERFSLAMLGANDGLWDWNLKTDEVYYSPRWKQMLGYDNDELDNTFDTWKTLVHPDDKDFVCEKVNDYINGRTPFFEVEMRMIHKQGHTVVVLSRAYCANRAADGEPKRLVGTHLDITTRKKVESFSEETARILEMIAIGSPATEVYDAIALMYEKRHPGMRCSMLELEGDTLLHGGAPSMPTAYCEAVHGLKIGPDIGSCGTSTYTGERCLVENIETDPKWAGIKHLALPHGMRCCWSEPIKHSDGHVLGAFGMYYNRPGLPNEKESEDLLAAARLAGIVMERDHAQQRIWQLAYQDELTGLASRASFYQRLNHLIKVSERQRQRFGLLYIDLDDFKNVNDSLGHNVGDLLLQELAKRLTKVGREGDFVGRLGGDEFSILVENPEDDFVLTNLAQRCLETLAQPLKLMARKLVPACSIGIARYPDDGKSAASILKAADTALYAAKERGKYCYACYRPELAKKAAHSLQFEQALREAIENQQLSIVYQLQVDVSSRRIVGAEALSRWRHPSFGNVSPVEFIATAEKIGMIKPLTEWVLYTACRQLVSWKNSGTNVPRIAVNISPSHFLDPDLVGLVNRVIEDTGIAPEALELEVTESFVQTDVKNLPVFKDLKNSGIQLAIDDFGTGYSSLSSLRHLTVDCLKIDKYFIHDMLKDKEALILISSMVELGHNLGYEIVAEGVETAEQLAMVEKLGCETAQGYFFSQPLSGDKLADLLDKDPFNSNYNSNSKNVKLEAVKV